MPGDERQWQRVKRSAARQSKAAKRNSGCEYQYTYLGAKRSRIKRDAVADKLEVIGMRSKLRIVVEKGRIIEGRFASKTENEYNGAFRLRSPFHSTLFVISSDGGGWEHVSVSVVKRKGVPTWKEMCWVKELFWEDEEVVMQLHPPKSEYVNTDPYTLHLWKPVEREIPTPPWIMVGFKGVEFER